MTESTKTALMQAPGDVDKLDKLRRYRYEPGCVRWLMVQERAGPLAHKAPKGWRVDILELEWHPITFDRLQSAQTWVRETFTGD